MSARQLVPTVRILLATAALAACRQPVTAAPRPDTATVSTTTTSTVVPASTTTRTTTTVERKSTVNVDSVGRVRADSLAALASASADAQRIQAELANVLSQRVYFDYDRDNLRDDATTALDAKAAILLANPSVTVAITGHTDERGTAEYNLALGQRRAAQVKRYLVAKGIADARLSTQSLGDSQPAAQGTDEAAYQQNRRAEFEVAGAGRTLVRPQP